MPPIRRNVPREPEKRDEWPKAKLAGPTIQNFLIVGSRRSLEEGSARHMARGSFVKVRSMVNLLRV